MDIKTKFNVGERVSTINLNTLKVETFEIGCISVNVREDGETHICYIPKGSSVYSFGYEENKCFTSKEELFSYIDTNEK